jgi:tRNA pseudouridine65 synthase
VSGLKIHFQDERFVVIDKPPGILVHRSRQSRDTEFVLQMLRDQIDKHVFPVHRIDRPASGILAFALSSDAARVLQASLDEGTKEYTTMVRGETSPAFSSDRPLTNDNGVVQEAFTEFETLQTRRGFSMVKARLGTGRRHQIRRHLSHLAHQIIGDTAHGKGRINRWLREEYGLTRLFLHASSLKCSLFEIESPLPEDLCEFLAKFWPKDPPQSK